jgi:hypothetical protein
MPLSSPGWRHYLRLITNRFPALLIDPCLIVTSPHLKAVAIDVDATNIIACFRTHARLNAVRSVIPRPPLRGLLTASELEPDVDTHRSGGRLAEASQVESAIAIEIGDPEPRIEVRHIVQGNGDGSLRVQAVGRRSE